MKKTFRYIFLTRGRVALVDWDDFEPLSRMRWAAVLMNKGKLVYAYRTDRNPGETAPMARIILGCGRSRTLKVDHLNHDTLDNRRQNLRLCTSTQNGQNSFAAEDKIHSRYKGVSKKRGGNTSRWCGKIVVHGYAIHLGYHATEKEAAQAYDKAAKIFFGEFACLNFP